MGQGGQHGSQVFNNCLAAARQVDDDALTKYSRCRAGYDGMRRFCHAGGKHCLGEAGQVRVQQSFCHLGRYVARRQSSAASGADDVISLAQGQLRQQGTQFNGFIRQHKTLTVAQRHGGGNSFGYGRATQVFAHAA